MADKITLDALVEGGKATAGPPLGPALGPLGVNVTKIIEEINKKTKAFNGLKVPVKLSVDKKTKEFEIEVGTPSVSALLKKESGIELGAKEKAQVVGNVSFDQVLLIAHSKETMARSLKAKAKEVVGTCVSMGITVEGKNPREIEKAIDEGKYDSAISKAEES